MSYGYCNCSACNAPEEPEADHFYIPEVVQQPEWDDHKFDLILDAVAPYHDEKFDEEADARAAAKKVALATRMPVAIKARHKRAGDLYTIKVEA